MFVILQWRPYHLITLARRRGVHGMVFGPLGSVLTDISFWLSFVYFPFENLLLHRDDLHTPSSPYFPVRAQLEGFEGPFFYNVISHLFAHVRNQFFFCWHFGRTVELLVGGIYLCNCGVWLNWKRIIRCCGEVEDYMANMIVAQLLYLDAVDPKKVCILSFLFLEVFVKLISFIADELVSVRSPLSCPGFGLFKIQTSHCWSKIL